MIFIFGGAYQGKLDYAKENYSIETVCDCSDGREPDFEADAIYALEGFVRSCARNGIEAKEYFEQNKSRWEDKIIILTDVSQGVVPMDKEDRDFREMNGRLGIYLAAASDEAVRVFCGIGEVISK